MSTAAENLPAKFGKYTLIRHLATGGMAELYLSLQRSISGFEKLIVIKKILPRYAADREFIDMFLDEARIAATLNHPNIVQIFDVGSVGKDYFIAMEFIHGEDLRNIVGAMRKKKMRSFPLEHAVSIIMGVCKGLSFAHDHRGLTGDALNIVHRDISPQNILVTFNGEVKVVDFGIARAMAKDAGIETEKSGALRGKFPYMSPEQIKGLNLDMRSDIFSVGIVLFELTTGRRLFKGKNELETLSKIVDNEYPKPSSVTSNYPRDLEEIVLTALQKDRDLRYSTALTMQQELEDFARNHKIKVSTIELGKFMEDLFYEKIQQEREALKEGKKLADIIAEKEANEIDLDEFLDLSSMPSSGGTTGRAMATDSAAVSGIMAMPMAEDRKRKGALFFAVITLIVLVVASAGAFFGYQMYTKAQESALQIGRVNVITDPPGAAVYVDGEKYPGETPLTLDKLKADVRYGIKVKIDGYEPAKREVSITQKQPTLELKIKLKPIKAAGMAVLKVETNVPEAVFILDGEKMEGKGSITLSSVKPEAPHTLFIQAPEYTDHTEKLALKPGEVRELKVELEPRPLGEDEFALVLETDPEGAAVTVDGKKLDGLTPGKWRLSWKQSMSLFIEKDRYKKKEIAIKPVKGKELTLAENLDKKSSGTSSTGDGGTEAVTGPGFLYLNSDPWANVTIPGVGKYQTPIANLKVPSGKLKIILENPPSGLKKTISVKIKPGETVKKKVKLSE